jgi:hypothetical protein
MNRRRLEAEEIRDSVLAVSGKLDRTMGGPGFELFRFKDDHSPVYDHTAIERINDPKGWRRGVYRFAVRSVPNPFLECLDGADPNLNTPVRNTTLTALQALALLNDPFILQQAGFLAERLRAETARGQPPAARAASPPAAGGVWSSTERQLDRAYRLALGRPATAEERGLMADYAAQHGLANACRLLLNTNEFVFVD